MANDPQMARARGTCRLCDEPVGVNTYTFYNHRPVHRKCLEQLCVLMPGWVPNDVREHRVGGDR